MRLQVIFGLILVIVAVSYAPAVDARKVAPFAATAHRGGGTETSIDVPSTAAMRFRAWMRDHGKTYENEAEELSRRAVWLENELSLADLSRKIESASTPSNLVLAMNEFSDLSTDEFNSVMKGLLFSSSDDDDDTVTTEPLSMDELKDLPTELDWREKGVVSPVKNQGMCGSCWAFSTTGALESANALASGKMVELSEQELLSCSRNGNFGCRGGLMTNAMKWIKWNGGIDSESDYPYRGFFNLKPYCQKKKEKNDKAVGVAKFTPLPPKDNVALMKAVTSQPISIGIDAASPAFQSYHSGVIPASVCTTQIDHGVLLVGYGTDKDTGVDYWLIKNSWGKRWSEDGFFRLERTMAPGPGTCGITLSALFPAIGPTHATPDGPPPS